MATEQKKEKKNIFRRMKDRWDGLTNDQQWACVVGIWTLDGLLWGSYLTARYKDKQIAKAEEIGAYKGYICGQMDAYKELAQNPYQHTNNGTNRLERQNIAKKF